MYENCIGGIVFTSYHNCNYYSGFMYTAFGRPYGLVVTLDDCVTISAGIDGGHPWRRSYAENLTYTDWHRDNFYRAVRRAMGDIPGKIGLEYDHVTIENLAKFEAIWPEHEKEDISQGVMNVRMFKSPEEIKLITDGARIADIGGAAAVEALAEGVPEFEVARAATSAMVEEISTLYPHSDLMDTWTWFQSGINTDGAHNPVTSKPIRKGEILSLNCFPMISGYYTALERTMFLDHVSKEHLKLWEANVDVHKRGLELIKPGAKCSEIAAELNDMYRMQGLLQFRSFGYGHSFGTLCHYYGREADLELREDVETILRPGMVVSMEPMIMIPEGKPGAGGYREHDILVVTKDGNRNLTKFPFGPEHNIIKK